MSFYEHDTSTSNDLYKTAIEGLLDSVDDISDIEIPTPEIARASFENKENIDFLRSSTDTVLVSKIERPDSNETEELRIQNKYLLERVAALEKEISNMNLRNEASKVPGPNISVQTSTNFDAIESTPVQKSVQFNEHLTPEVFDKNWRESK